MIEDYHILCHERVKALHQCGHENIYWKITQNKDYIEVKKMKHPLKI